MKHGELTSNSGLSVMSVITGAKYKAVHGIILQFVTLVLYEM